MARLTFLFRVAALVIAAGACYVLVGLSADLRRLSRELDALRREVTAMGEDLAAVADDVSTLADDVDAIANSLGCEEESPEHVPLRGSSTVFSTLRAGRVPRAFQACTGHQAIRTGTRRRLWVQ